MIIDTEKVVGKSVFADVVRQGDCSIDFLVEQYCDNPKLALSIVGEQNIKCAINHYLNSKIHFYYVKNS